MPPLVPIVGCLEWLDWVDPGLLPIDVLHRLFRAIPRLQRAPHHVLVLPASVAGAAGEAPTDCAGAARAGWSPAESWVWRQICAGAVAELDKGTGASDASRKLSPTFMTALFFDPQLKALIPHSGVHIAG